MLKSTRKLMCESCDLFFQGVGLCFVCGMPLVSHKSPLIYTSMTRHCWKKCFYKERWWWLGRFSPSPLLFHSFPLPGVSHPSPIGLCFCFTSTSLISVGSPTHLPPIHTQQAAVFKSLNHTRCTKCAHVLSGKMYRPSHQVRHFVSTCWVPVELQVHHLQSGPASRSHSATATVNSYASVPELYFWVQYIDILFQNICILLSNADCKKKLCVKLHRVSLILMGLSESCEWVISAWVKTVEVHLSSWVDACWCDLHSSFSGEVGFSNHKAMFAHYRSLDYDLIFLFQNQKHASESDLNRCYIRAQRPRLVWFSH